MKNGILVVDDEKEITTLLCAALRDTYRVIAANSGAEAIAAFRRTPVPLVLTDIRMPGIDGFLVTHALKIIEPACEVILMSGYTEATRILDVLNEEAFAIVLKPLRLDLIRRRLEQASLFVEGRRAWS